MVVECTFADTAEECCDTSEGKSRNWNVKELAVHYDVISVDSAFLTSLSAHLLTGAALQTQCKNYNTSFYKLLAAAAQITHGRSASRLNSTFLTFMGATSLQPIGSSATTCIYRHPLTSTHDSRWGKGASQRWRPTMDSLCFSVE